MLTVIWDMQVKPDAAAAARGFIRQIWTDMTRFDGYISHRILEDDDRSGHFVVVGEWTSRAVADRIRDEYAGAEPVKQLQPLLTAPRQRTVFVDPA